MNYKDIPTEYPSDEEFDKKWIMEDYAPNRKLDDIGDDPSLAVKCINGTFVGYMQDDVRIWKGIPYAKPPVGELRFKKSEVAGPCDGIFEAKHFGMTGMQPADPGEMASMFKQGEDFLCLNVWNSSSDDCRKKPVLFFIHGGGLTTGGTVDPLYNGFNLTHYNPDIILVTATYRMGIMGQINLRQFPDSEGFETSMNNGLLDQVTALKWVKANIAGFGGDPDNITIIGESIGGCSVSMLCVLPEAKGLFQKAIPMSGSTGLSTPLEAAGKIPAALIRDFGVKTVKDIQAIPFDQFREWWAMNCMDTYTHYVRDDVVVATKMMDRWNEGFTKDLIIMQGHTANEFRYYFNVFLCVGPMFDAICNAVADTRYASGSDAYREAYERYKKALLDLGYPEEEVVHEFMNDYSLSTGNTYQALQHAKNGGKGFSYTFEEPYDGIYNHLGAAHAIDCFYLFGTFSPKVSFGTKEHVDFSRRFQRMIANFCKTGNPSLEDLEWPEYKYDTRMKMMLSSTNMRVEENPEGERVKAMMEMMDLHDDVKYIDSISSAIPIVAEKHPEALAEYMAKYAELQNSNQ